MGFLEQSLVKHETSVKENTEAHAFGCRNCPGLLNNKTLSVACSITYVKIKYTGGGLTEELCSEEK